MKQIVVSFSGGRTSAYLCSLIKKLYPDAVFVFMDTGAEHEATYEFIKQVNDYFDLNLICLRTVVSDKWARKNLDLMVQTKRKSKLLHDDMFDAPCMMCHI